MSKEPEDIFNEQLMVDDTITNNIYLPNNQMPPNKRMSQNDASHQKSASLTQCRILLKKSSKLNKKLMGFFEDALYDLNNAGLKFDWIPVYEDEIEQYEEQDISKFPTLVIENTNIFGVSNIIDRLTYILNTYDTPQSDPHSNNRNVGYPTNRTRTADAPTNRSKPMVVQTDEDMKDFFMAELRPGTKNEPANEEDDDDDFSKHVSQRMASMYQQRKQMGQDTPNSDNAEDQMHNRRTGRETPQPNASKTVQNKAPANSTKTMDIIKNNRSLDDDFMNKYWENQETTEM